MKDATPLTRLILAIWKVPVEKVTEPEGVPAVLVTVAFSVTVAPSTTLCGVAVRVAVVEAGASVTSFTAELPEACVLSPE